MFAVEVPPRSGLIRDIGADRIEDHPSDKDTRDSFVTGESSSCTACAGWSTWWELTLAHYQGGVTNILTVNILVSST